MYGQENPTLDLVVSSLRTKDLEIKVFNKGYSSDSLIVRGKTKKKDKGYRIKSKNKSKSKNKKKCKMLFFVKIRVIIGTSVLLGKEISIINLSLVIIVILTWFFRVRRIMRC